MPVCQGDFLFAKRGIAMLTDGSAKPLSLHPCSLSCPLTSQAPGVWGAGQCHNLAWTVAFLP